LFAGSPYSVGVVGTFATPIASELLNGADLVLTFGAALNHYTTYFGSIFGKARIIQVDADPAALSRYQAVDIGVIADARIAAVAIVDELKRRAYGSTGYRTAETATRIAEFRIEAGLAIAGTSEGMNPHTLMATLDRILPAERVVIVDGGNHMEFSITHLSTPDASSFLWPIEYGSIGCALGNALGAAVARPDRVSVLCIGDLDTAVRYRLPLIVLVSNDGALGAELHYLRQNGYADECARHQNPAFEEVARGLGLDSATINSIADLENMRERFSRLNGPLLLDCKVNRDIAASYKAASRRKPA
jgi:thiamine pyrophosphate-dependent acetolactate synthase large subunit-like protein